jgi:hypothetical protein
VRESETIHRDIQRRFEEMTHKTIQEGSVMDFYTVATSDALEDVYKEIEDNKTPHIYTGLKGKNLDDFGFFVNCPRQPDESDEQYLYRTMNWKLRSEASNTTAIQNALLSMEFASNVEYIPLTNGCGTATAFIIPKNYEEETIEKALEETKERISSIVSPSLYIDYIVPSIVPVRIHIYMQSEDGDTELIKGNLDFKIRNYINEIPPTESLHVGAINRMGINEPQVNFFSVLQVFIDNEETKEIEILQGLETKLILDEIIWA